MRATRRTVLLGAALLAAAGLLVFVAAGPETPDLLWILEAELTGEAPPDVRESDPGGTRLREGWYPHVLLEEDGTGDLHLHRDLGDPGGLRGEFARWSRRLPGVSSGVIYRRTAQREAGDGRVWVAFARTESRCDWGR